MDHVAIREAYQYSNGYTDPKIPRRRCLLGQNVPIVGLQVQRQESQRPIDWGLVLKEPEKLYFVDQNTKQHDELVSNSFHRHHSLRPSIQSFESESGQMSNKVNMTSFKSLPTISRPGNQQLHRAKPQQYWELGKLGPDLTDPQRIQQQMYKQRTREFSERVWEINKSVKYKQPSSLAFEGSNCMSHRTRALQYSKSIQKPTRKAAQGSNQLKEVQEKQVLVELERLEREHEQHRKRIEQIANEMKRRGI